MSALRPQGLWAPRGVWRGLWRGRVRLSQKARSRPGILAGTASISSRADRRDPGEGGGGQTAPCGPCSARWPGSPCSAPRAPTPMLIPPPRDSAYCTILKVYKPRSQLPSISPRSSPEAACAHPSGSGWKPHLHPPRPPQGTMNCGSEHRERMEANPDPEQPLAE
ncbi:placenta-specific protein 9 isoform X3 [Rhinolophus ferrumequinum]|uniref:placenta-specific protein 9 isoform X3 n=1 Tax=Rhinolophus ferrumequinum TaxID=59479 RepID=UPI00140FD9C6|nr:placenta-specific protein 9 isoform X3 [Rhinolophus ferrumequinum]